MITDIVLGILLVILLLMLYSFVQPPFTMFESEHDCLFTEDK